MAKRIHVIGLVISGCAFAVACSSATAGDWPCWRGANHDGKSTETKFVKTWGDKGPKVLWERELGEAYSSFAVVGDHVFTCGSKDGHQVVFCLDTKTGKTVWEHPFAKAYDDSQGSGTRATPTIDAGRLYIFGAQGTLVCLDAKSGKPIWKRKFDHPPQWGYSGSVLIEENLAILSPGNADGSLLAVDKTTGKDVWKCGDSAAGYATPYPFSFKDTRYICGFLANAAIIADAKTGKLIWSTPWQTDWKVNAATPIFHKEHLFLASGYHTGCALFKLTKDGEKLKGKEIWRSQVLMSKFQTPILHKGKLYSSDQEAMKCVDFMTGERAWRERRIKHGTIVFADGHIILHTEKGKVEIGKASSKGWDPKASVQVLDGRCWTLPVLSNGHLYLRNMDKAVCLDLSE